MDQKRTLCQRCAGDYRTAGYNTLPAGYQEIKESCDLCGRPGIEYIVVRRKGSACRE